MESLFGKNVGELTSFGIDSISNQYIVVKNREEIIQSLKYLKESNKYYILGGGSNTIFLNDFKGLVLHIQTKGIKICAETEEMMEIEVQAGEDWNDFVEWAVKKNLWGIENLTAIPGLVGACPIQNIGAYGSEVKDVIKSVEFVEIETGNISNISNEKCTFGYRDSIFKKELKNKVIILSVKFQLSKKEKLNLEYADIQNEITKYPAFTFTSKSISELIFRIRQSKLPDPKLIGNSGSFFKNPVIEMSQLQHLKFKFPEIKFYPINDFYVKLPAAWLIDACGWKGKQNKGCKVHEKQALVITNFAHTSGEDLIDTYKKIQSDVFSKFGVEIEPEVNLIIS